MVQIIQPNPIENLRPEAEHFVNVPVKTIRTQHNSLLKFLRGREMLTAMIGNTQAPGFQFDPLRQLPIVHLSRAHVRGHAAEQRHVREEIFAEMLGADEGAEVGEAVGRRGHAHYGRVFVRDSAHIGLR